MQSRNSTTTPNNVAQELVTDAELDFYIECAQLAGVSLADWFISEPFLITRNNGDKHG